MRSRGGGRCGEVTAAAELPALLAERGRAAGQLPCVRGDLAPHGESRFCR